jgi:hypothetical protein
MRERAQSLDLKAKSRFLVRAIQAGTPAAIPEWSVHIVDAANH